MSSHDVDPREDVVRALQADGAEFRAAWAIATDAEKAAAWSEFTDAAADRMDREIVVFAAGPAAYVEDVEAMAVEHNAQVKARRAERARAHALSRRGNDSVARCAAIRPRARGRSPRSRRLATRTAPARSPGSSSDDEPHEPDVAGARGGAS